MAKKLSFSSKAEMDVNGLTFKEVSISPQTTASVVFPSRKKSRFSGKRREKRVRFISSRSDSTCEKSVLTVIFNFTLGLMR